MRLKKAKAKGKRAAIAPPSAPAWYLFISGGLAIWQILANSRRARPFVWGRPVRFLNIYVNKLFLQAPAHRTGCAQSKSNTS